MVRLVDAGEFVERVVVDALEDRIEQLLHIAEVNGPAHHGIERCIQVQPQRVGVTMDAATEITGWRTCELQRAVEARFLPDPIVLPVEMRAAACGLVDRDP